MYGLIGFADEFFDVGIDFYFDIFEFGEGIECINKVCSFSLEQFASFLPQFEALVHFLLHHFYISDSYT